MLMMTLNRKYWCKYCSHPSQLRAMEMVPQQQQQPQQPPMEMVPSPWPQEMPMEMVPQLRPQTMPMEMEPQLSHHRGLGRRGSGTWEMTFGAWEERFRHCVRRCEG